MELHVTTSRARWPLDHRYPTCTRLTRMAGVNALSQEPRTTAAIERVPNQSACATRCTASIHANRSRRASKRLCATAMAARTSQPELVTKDTVGLAPMPCVSRAARAYTCAHPQPHAYAHPRPHAHPQAYHEFSKQSAGHAWRLSASP